MSESLRNQDASYDLDWGGTTWELRLDRPVPGLYDPATGIGPVLGLEGLRAAGRSAPTALEGAALVSYEAQGSTISATFAPLGWGAIWVNARWTVRNDDTLDLLVEVQARTVNELHGVEVMVLSKLGPMTTPGGHRSVEPRDARSAGLTYDGRELDLAALVTGPPDEHQGPWLVPKTSREGWAYAEFSHANDVSRRILEGKLPFLVARHALFGHDLEKGLVLRARLQATWLPKATAINEVERRFDAFRKEPLPLST